MNQQSLVWKILAIIFICLFIIETVFLIFAFDIGMKMTKQNNKCLGICTVNKEYSAYYYDSYNNVCYCITPNGEFILQ